MLEWPIIADAKLRDELVSRVVARPGRVQLISGDSGIGKTTLASAIARSLEAQGYGILPVVGLAELSAIPLGAMTPLLARSQQGLELGAAERLQALFAHVATGGGKRVLMVDDAPLLDEISAASVYQLIRVYGIACVMTARNDSPLVGSLARLLDEHSLDTTELAGLRSDVARDIVRTALGGPVEPDSLAALVRMAHGNPLFLRELVLAAEGRGAIVETDVGFVVESAGIPPRLRDSIAARLSGLTPRQRTVAELISVAEPWPIQLLDEAESITALEEAGLTRRAATGELYLAHPVYAETLRVLMSPEVRERRQVEAAHRLNRSTTEDERFRAICLLDGTRQLPGAAELAWAAMYAHSLDDHALGARLADASLRQERTFDALFVRALALSSMGSLEAADDAFAESVLAADTDERRLRVASGHGYHLAFRRQRPSEAAAMATRIIGSVPDSPARQFLSADVAKWRLMSGDAGAPPVDLDSTEPLAPAAELNSLVFRLTAAIFASDLATAAIVIARGRELVDLARVEVPHGARLLDFGEFMTLALRGPIDTALATVPIDRTEPSDGGAGLWNWGLTLFTLQAGRADDALALASLAAEQLGWRDYVGALGSALAMRATAAALLGQKQFAEAILASLDTELRATMAVTLQAAQAEAWMLARSGDVEGAASVIASAVARGVDARYFGLAALTAHVAVRLGRADAVSESIAQIAEIAQGGVVASIVGHAQALADRDPAELIAAAERLAAVGLLAGAVDAASQAAAFARTSGKTELARRASVLAAQWNTGLTGYRPSAGGDRSEELTEREWVVALAAAGRARSKEIAAQLGVSARTVDNHLTNIYRKLGVSSRDELRVELAGMTGLE